MVLKKGWGSIQVKSWYSFPRNKRGIFFTTLVIVMLSLFVITFTFYSQVKDRQSIQKRIETLNNFVFSVEEDIPRQFRTSGFRIIFLFEKRIIETGSYITNLKSVFNEMFFNATMYGQTNTDIQTLMLGATFPEIESALKQKAAKINADINFINPIISVTQIDPWNIEVKLSSNLIIEDKSNLVLWNRTSDIKAYVSIQDFEDPLYLISTNGVVTNKIIKTPYKTFVSGSDILNLSDHSTNSYYINSTTAPNFLDRLEGINSPDPNGIESLVNLQKLSSQGVPVDDKTVVDYIYFDSTNNPTKCNVLPPGMPSWFKLDSPHLAAYNVTCTS